MARDATLRREPVLRASEPPVLRGEGRVSPEPALRDLPVTTTPGIEGRPVTTYLGIVTGEVVVGADILQDAPAPRGLFGRLRGRAAEERDGSLPELREKAIRDLKSRAAARGADAVVGVTLAMHVLGDSLVVTATGTAVRIG